MHINVQLDQHGSQKANQLAFNVITNVFAIAACCQTAVLGHNDEKIKFTDAPIEK